MTGRRAVFVVNPASDGGGTGRKWPEIAASARRHGLDVVERISESAGHATELTRAAVTRGRGARRRGRRRRHRERGRERVLRR